MSILLGSLLLVGCEPSQPASESVRERGKLLLRQFGCGNCHRIPGVATAEGAVGPPLTDVGRRAYLAGIVPNSLENMAEWIRSPRAFKPNTTMPDLGVTQAQAHAMAAYLQELR